ncbi:DUF4167 domain-containing protein [Govanella unica]|uniref:DUF4167 domain-containing protein n=1 Tax=Govanella unica TaxID=2975056 RepID=A0A9X3TV87_9PROT|nr:DUF4167 domain-containing protein [Govania unica]MDA5192342.1 DUF4167 domain-containing protein [Govania unica]
MGGGGSRHQGGHGGQSGGQNGNYNAGGRQKRSNLLGKQIESNGPEGRVRGTVLQLYERYKTAARETQASDRVLSEVYGQFAEHYYRLASEFGAFEQAEVQRREGFEGEDDGDDETDGDGSSETDGQASSQQSHVNDPQSGERQQPDRSQGDRSQADRPQGDPQQAAQPSFLSPDLETGVRSSAFAGQPAIVRESVMREAARSGDRFTPASPVVAPVAAEEQESGIVSDSGGDLSEPRRRGRPRKDEVRRDEPVRREDSPRAEQPRVEQPRVEQPRREEMRREEPRRDEPRRDEHRRQEPRREEPRRDEPRRQEAGPSFTAGSAPGFLSTPFKSASRNDAFKSSVQVEVVRRRRVRADDPASAGTGSSNAPVETPANVPASIPVQDVTERPIETVAPVQTQVQAQVPEVAADEAPAPRRRGRPRKNPLPVDETN